MKYLFLLLILLFFISCTKHKEYVDCKGRQARKKCLNLEK